MAAERKRGCGYRKIGGLYLCSDGPGEPCHRLPIPLEVCPTCHAGIKQTRGWTWVKPDLLGGQCSGVISIEKLRRDRYNVDADLMRVVTPHCSSCPACVPSLLGDKAGLLWIGGQFYKRPEDFTREAMAMGVSRRISTIPRGFEVGKHWGLLAHPRVIEKRGCNEPQPGRSHMDNCGRSGPTDVIVASCKKDCACWCHEQHYAPGIFHVFKPNRIEKILADNAKPEEIQEWEKRGCKVVLLPANDKDHRGSVHDDEDEPSFLNLDEAKGVL